MCAMCMLLADIQLRGVRLLSLQHTNLENRVLEPPDGPCVPEGYPYPSNHSCYLYVPKGHYKCDCRMDYGVEKEAMELKNGYRVCAELITRASLRHGFPDCACGWLVGRCLQSV